MIPFTDFTFNLLQGKRQNMKSFNPLAFITILIVTVFFGGCNMFEADEEVDVEPIYTQAAQTMVARLTQEAPQVSPTPVPTETSLPTPSPLPPTATETPTQTPTSTSIPTDTPMPTPTETPVTVFCDWAEFVDDITIEDGTTFTPGVEFVKTWRLRNIGTCTWNSEYELVFAAGDRMDADAAVSLPGTILPGQSVDLSVQMEAPEEAGDYRGEWLLRNENGVLFGLGDDANLSFWVAIEVIEPNFKYPYDFAINYCAADWESGEGRLPCPGRAGDDDGFVILLENPELENRMENEPTLWVHPNEDEDGWITAKYPAFRVRRGDRLQTWVGCLSGSENCDVSFIISYQIAGGPVRNLGTWHEVYDGKISQVDIDLTSLRSEFVQFIFSVEVEQNPRAADAFWFVPRIERFGDVE
jgi:hypothetical protein